MNNKTNKIVEKYLYEDSKELVFDEKLDNHLISLGYQKGPEGFSKRMDMGREWYDDQVTILKQHKIHYTSRPEIVSYSTYLDRFSLEGTGIYRSSTGKDFRLRIRHNINLYDKIIDTMYWIE